ncbi:MAG: glycosyltransferase family 4 protein [Bacteroidetes bacterium]|nr:glycosyltransferase family 4 protein [Bacteroidota bacterium]
MKTPLQIVALDIPYPPNYGGTIDIYYKIKALAEEGMSIILHCFEYDGKRKAPQLETICERVYYYKRNKSPLALLSVKPFILRTRSHPSLLESLKSHSAPILFEGIHSCAYLGHSYLRNHPQLVRMHNIEWAYYRKLRRIEPSVLKKLYFLLESWKLKRFEKQLFGLPVEILCISPSERDYFRNRGTSVHYIPPINGYNKVEVKTGRGKHILFHGKLIVRDNEKAALFLINEVMSKVNYPCVIAGLRPSRRIIEAARLHSHIKVMADLTVDEMEKLIRDAHISLLYSFQSEGMKLKLLNSLYMGRYCIANDMIIRNTGLEELCVEANSSSSILEKVHKLWKTDFSQSDLNLRIEILEGEFSDQCSAQKIIQILNY